MTGNEMITQFSLNYGQDLSPDVMGIETAEILVFLNQAVDDLVRDLYNAGNLIPLSILLERGTGYAASSLANGIGNSTSYNASSISEQFQYYVTSRIKVTKTFPLITSEWVTNELVSVVSDKYIQTAYNKPMFQRCKVMKIQSSSELSFLVVFDSYTTSVTDFMLEYLRIHTPIVASDTEFELDSSLHPDIIKRAVTLVLETVQSQRVQTQPIIDK